MDLSSGEFIRTVLALIEMTGGEDEPQIRQARLTDLVPSTAEPGVLQLPDVQALTANLCGACGTLVGIIHLIADRDPNLVRDVITDLREASLADDWHR